MAEETDERNNEGKKTSGKLGSYSDITQLISSQKSFLEKISPTVSMLNSVASHNFLPKNVMDSLTMGQELARKMAISPNALVMTAAVQQNHAMAKMMTSTSATSKIFVNPGFIRNITATSDIFSKYANLMNKFQPLSSPAMDAVMGMNQRFDYLFKGNQAIKNIMMASPWFTQMNSLQHTLAKLNMDAVREAEAVGNWDDMEAYQQITDTAMAIGEIARENTNEIGQAIDGLIEMLSAFYQKNKKLGLKAYHTVNIILMVLGCYTFYDDKIREKPAVVTQAEYQTGQSEQKKRDEAIQLSLSQLMAQQGDSRKTKDITRISLKPYPNSNVICTLPAWTAVTVLQSKGRWAYISFYDAKDKLPQNGWVMKKYLRKL